MRLDLFLAVEGYEKSRERAKTLITGGAVRVNGQTVTKPAFDTAADSVIEITDTLKYVSRGGMKLEFALSAFDVDVKNADCIDIGASTGGFTDCLLQHGAKRVYAVDVGTNQLDPKLSADSRVVSVERMNILSDDFRAGESVPPDIIVCDVSFVSVTKILSRIKALMNERSRALILIKPQFEIKAHHKNGIVKDKKERAKAVSNVTEAAAALGFKTSAAKECPVPGRDGNVEYFMLMSL
jgi:23S rRNA (cytidine1920-2'-O)/16S rRNA (cytidine1409-2'-O)-methyltransferase